MVAGSCAIDLGFGELAADQKAQQNGEWLRNVTELVIVIIETLPGLSEKVTGRALGKAKLFHCGTVFIREHAFGEISSNGGLLRIQWVAPRLFR